ncbi:nitrate- and nitrite sensing domain-containing protein [Actinoplanes sp. NPDC051861]|uniref:sensor histidine kinase n=1 Tax=Actinoplanes sp. NPDC051861 TaxID=3155170 RepID=UPI00341D0058
MSRSGYTIRGRVVRMLALPVAAMLVLLTAVVAEEFSDYRLAARTERAVDLDLAVQALVHQVQTERGVTVGLLAGDERFRAQLLPARKRVDEQRAAVEDLVAAGGGLEEQVIEALGQMATLSGIREEADRGEAERAEVFDDFNELIDELGDVYFALDNAADARMRLGSEALTMLNAAIEVTAQQRAFLTGVLTAGGFRTGEFLRFVKLRADRDIALKEFEEYATPQEIATKDYLFGTAPASVATRYEQLSLRSGDGLRLRGDPREYWTALETVLADMANLAGSIGVSLQARAETLLDRANLRLAGLATITLICIGGAVYLATAAARSMARPLAELAKEANRLASERLPEAVRRAAADDGADPPDRVRVPGGATSEVVLVADAFSRVQETAYTLATEQARLRRTTAESLANLGRRNQNLLRRQLGFITRLEREESNPAGLANLFELDHLATRMRRNAESLLVLVGAASPRQWSSPLPLTDVIRAAVSEVEEYRRVSLRRLDEVMVAGSVVSGLAHMLAELIENGLAFSPPDLDVEIHGRVVEGGYLIAVCDQGVGMSKDDLDRSNQRLRGEGDFLTAPARFLGHYVVGRLAAGMGVQVELARSPVTGVTARVALPTAILADPPALTPPNSSATPRPPHAPAHLTRGPRPRAVEVDYVVVPDQPDTTPASPDPASLDRASRDHGSQDRAALAPATLDRASQDHGSQDRATQDRAALAPASQDHGSQDRATLDRAALDPAAMNRAALDPAAMAAAAFAEPSSAPLDHDGPGRVAVPGAHAVPSPRRPSAPPSPIAGFHAAIPAAGAIPAAVAGPEPPRTANGLRIRVPRAARAEPVLPVTQPDPSPLVADGPDAVRTRLTALRDGIRRGTGAPPPTTPPTFERLS